MIFFCVGVMYSGEYDACDVTLSVYPHQAGLKNMPFFIGLVLAYFFFTWHEKHVIQ
jgi:hypothetical protein